MRRLALFVLLLFCFAVTAIGYAALTDEMRIEGSISASPPPRGLFIVGLEVVASQGVTDMGSAYSSPTNVASSVTAKAGGSITYRITVENRTDVTYWYRGILYDSALVGTDNASLGASGGISVATKDKLADPTATFNTDDWVPPHATRDFYAIYTFGANAAGARFTFLNFSFGGRLISYADEFLAILNTPDRYSVLAGEFNREYAEDGSTVLGNVGADEAFFDGLFGTELTLDGQPVTVMIQRANVDGKSTGDSYLPHGPASCEYTLYVTTEDPATGSPTVYAVSYTREPSGEWVQIGELYEGTTDIGTYTDSNGTVHTAFNPASWEAVPKTYTVFTYMGQSVTYKVNQRYGNSFQQQYKLTDLMSMVDQELYNQLNNHRIMKDTYKILFVDHPNSTAPEILLLREAYEDALRFYEMRNSGQEFSLDNSATRAELLSTVEALAKAMEYYLQVHDTNHS